MMTVERIIDGKIAMFSHIKDGCAYYCIIVLGFAYSFPVELDKLGNRELKHRDTAKNFEFWIRKAIHDKTFKRN
jgi:hexokinase